MPAESSTASLPRIATSQRSASAMASEARADADPAGEPQLGVEDLFADLGDVDCLEPDAERLDDVAHQVVGERTDGLDALLVERDRRGLDRADPDRQVPDAVLLAQQQDRVIRRQLDPHPDDPQRMHDRPPG